MRCDILLRSLNGTDAELELRNSTALAPTPTADHPNHDLPPSVLTETTDLPDALVTPPPASRFPHLRALDGLRGLAVVLVLLSHFTPELAPGGFLGVDLFFLLSGFLITSLLVAEWESSGAIALGRFWVRRARRLLPALMVVLVVVGLHAFFFSTPAEQHQLGLDGLASLFYVANWRFIASGQSYVMQFVATEPSPLRHMWSLAIEEQFYLIWPLVTLAVAAVVRRFLWRGRHANPPLRSALAGVSIALALVSAGWMVVKYHAGNDLDRLYYGTDTRVFMILVGAAIGAVTAGRPGVPDRWRVVMIGLGTAGVVALLVATIRVETTTAWLYAGGYAGLALVFAAVLLGTAQPGPNPLSWVLSFPEPPEPLMPDEELAITLVGNSLAGEVRPCITEILGRRGVTMETVNPPDFLICREAAAIKEQATNPETRPDAAILFLFVAGDGRCGEPWHAVVDDLIDTWVSQGTHVFLVPSVSLPEGGAEWIQEGADLEAEYYQQRAAADPGHVTAVDAGRFLRDLDGTYLWRMPCARADEAGCRLDGTVPVRFTDGLHFCTDADFPARGCVRPEAAAGQRRAATAITNTVIEVMSRHSSAAPAGGDGEQARPSG